MNFPGRLHEVLLIFVEGIMDKKQTIVMIAIFIFGGLAGGYITKIFLPTIQTLESSPIEVIREVLVNPEKLAVVLHEPYPVAAEIVKEIATAKPRDTPVVTADKTIVVREIQTIQPTVSTPTTTTTVIPPVTLQPINKYYDITLDRKYSIGALYTNHGIAGTVSVAPNKNLAVNVIYGKDLYGGGVAIRF